MSAAPAQWRARRVDCTRSAVPALDLREHACAFGGALGALLLAVLARIALRREYRMTVDRARKIQKFLSQPFFVAQQFTGMEGKYVKLEETINSFEEILEGKCDHIPEQDFQYKGTIDEVKAAFAKREKEA